ncbi:multidrug resistance-associated protein 1-like isoform X2 [Tetranychus urticae]|uniref:multidrug resistance-associated protein 1-like isoform X2 n=1 Tax=Tetranychus urticae TaxID=32264 RepID=UPI000D6502EB|nr:multidrug resistance-associated protein 1-like isoform X2 [Tetranychus urticae]
MESKQIEFESLCGDEIFWNFDSFWNSKSPKLSKCFMQTVLIWPGSLFLFVFSYFEYKRTLQTKNKTISYNKLNLTRLVLSTFCILINVFHLVHIIRKQSSNSYLQLTTAEIVAPSLNIISFVLISLFFYYHRIRGVHSSAFIWIYLSIQSICCSITTIQSWINFEIYSGLEIAIINAQCAAIILLLLLASFVDYELDTIATEGYEMKEDGESTVESSIKYKISFPSRLVFWWANKLIFLGWKKPLTIKDLWPLKDYLKSDFLLEKLKSKDKSLKLEQSTKSSIKTSKDSADAQKVNVVLLLFKTFGHYLLFGACLKLMQDILTFLTPELLKVLLNFIENQSSEPIWHGFFIAIVLFSVTCCQTLFGNYYFYKMYILGMRVQSALTAAVYSKSLTLNDEARKRFTTGQITNLMSVDVERIETIAYFANIFWSAPLQVIIALWLLYRELGYSSLFGAFVMLVMGPLDGIVVKYSEKFQEKLMDRKDKRIKFISEILNGIKIIKFYAWEESFIKHISSLRREELRKLKMVSYLDSVSSFIYFCSPTMVSVATFAAFILVQKETLTAQKAFVSLTLFNILRQPLTMLPELISDLIMALVSIKRLNKFLSSEDLDQYVTRNNEGNAITIKDASFRWFKNEAAEEKTVKKSLAKQPEIKEADRSQKKSINDEPTLQNINIEVKKDAFVAIIGSVGSGKSSLLSAILGEMKRVKGCININGKLRVAYVSQQAWIQNVTLRENILFGHKFDKTKYDTIVSACALDHDIAYLPNGDETEIGEKGINLSGGQKQRVSLARACYSDADIYLLDDPLSAVDAHVASHIFHHVLSSVGILGGKTRVLVTNKLNILSKVDFIYVLSNGVISETGTYNELVNSKGEFSKLIEQHVSKVEETDVEISDNGLTHDKVKPNEQSKLQNANNGKLIESETLSTGKVAWSIYIQYFKMFSIPWTVIFILATAISEMLSVGANVWLSKWSADSLIKNDSTVSVPYRLGIFAALGVSRGVASLVGSWALVNGSLRVSTIFHRKLLMQIFRAPISFFDINPSGRIINRFSKDLNTVDTTLRFFWGYWITGLFEVVSALVIISINIPLLIPALLPVGLLYWFLQRVYISSSRQLKRLESVSRSPIYSYFSETLNGLSTIRAFSETNQFMSKMCQKIDMNQSCAYPSIVANRWLNVRLELMGCFIVLLSSTFAVISRTSLDPSVVGLILSYALTISKTLSFLVRNSSYLETSIIAVERIIEYCQIPSEADWYKAKISPRNSWPEKGSIEFHDFETRYRVDTELIIKGITAKIEPKEKIGIVGRTGAGKSTITLSLFRLIEPSKGTISIDGYNICDLPLHTLRSRLAIIPQDPVLFSGSLRFNLDPFQNYSDEQIWDSLSQVTLKDFVLNTSEGLEYNVTEEGSNLSVGQKQLLCLARALLKKPKIISPE